MLKMAGLLLWLLCSVVSLRTVQATEYEEIDDYTEHDENSTEYCLGRDDCEETTLIGHIDNDMVTSHYTDLDIGQEPLYTHMHDSIDDPKEMSDPVASYVGEWNNNQKNGFGMLTSTNGDKYTGTWKNDMRHGTGTETYIDATYAGDFVNDKKHGKGKMTWDNGDKFWGEWAEGKRSGLGIFTMANGDKYVGRWVDGGKSGLGVFVPAAASNFVSDGMQEGTDGPSTMPRKKRGFAICEYESGDRSVGEVVVTLKDVAQPSTQDSSSGNDSDNHKSSNPNKQKPATGLCWWEETPDNIGAYDKLRLEGQSVYAWADGARYAGGFKAKDGMEYSQYEGKGMLTQKNGVKYVGEFQDGKYHGHGVESTPRGVASGYWEHGQFIE